MAKQFNFTIPGKVVPKARPRINGRQAYLPSGYRTWRNTALIELLAQEKPVNPMNSVCVGIKFYGFHRGDLDNLAGAVLDALVEAEIIEDDRLSVVNELAIRHIPNKETFCQIAISLAS